MGQPTQEWDGDFAAGWRRVDALVSEQKLEAASSLAEKMLAEAGKTRNNTEWTRALIRYTQLRIALHGYETAVRFLKQQPWPDDQDSAALLNLFYAKSLTTYAQAYSWEINQREKTASQSALDLKVWTRDQIYEEALKAFETVWNTRSRLGELPSDAWKEYIKPNTYPSRIRPSMRDAISYLLAETLADTAGWRPEQLNEIYRLNLKALMNDPGEVRITDPDRHPLEKISYALTDLESWHAQKKEPEAALEARLELYQRLHQHFRNEQDRKTIQGDLEQRLKPLAHLPWWSEGMAQLAEFVRQEDEPDALVRARNIALRGKEAFPQSPGSQHCSAILGEIEARQYDLSGMRMDALQKKSILVSHKNIPSIYFRAYAIDLLRVIQTSRDFSFLPNGGLLQNLTEHTAPVEQWETALPPTPDYRMHKTYIVPPLKKTGTYLIAASARPDFSQEDNIMHGLYLTIGDLALVTRRESRRIEAATLSASTGDPIAGAEVTLYRFDYRTGHHPVGSQKSDSRGIAVLRKDSQQGPFFLLARYGDQVAFDPEPTFFNETTQRSYASTLIFTDRSIYRPLQKISWKVIAYRQASGNGIPEISTQSPVTVSLVDTNGQKVESKTVTTNAFGTASGEFFIPAGRALGAWCLETSPQGMLAVRVEEYKRPTFEVEIPDPEEPLRLNRTARIKGQAKYHFGLPVSAGQVKWMVRRTPVFPLWWGFLRAYHPPSQPQIIAGGTTPLQKDGSFFITFSPEADERLSKEKEVTYAYSVSADVTDEGGETRSAQRRFQLGFISVKASAELEQSFLIQGESLKATVRRTNLDGLPKTGVGTWKIVSLKGPSRALLPAEQPLPPDPSKQQQGFQTPGDRERSRWDRSYNPETVLMSWEEGAVRASGSIKHDSKGEGTLSAPGLPGGAYRLIYETVDDFGEKFELRTSFIVAAKSLQLPLPAVLLVQNSPVKVGQTARLLAHSGLKDQLLVLEQYRDGNRIRRQEIRTGIDSSIVEIPITEQDRGGLGISLSLVRDHQFINLHKELRIPWDNKELKVEFSTFRDKLRPGQQETLSVKVSGPASKEAAVSAAELLAYMYDRSLDAFVPHTPANPLHLYPNRARATLPTANVRRANQVWLQSSGFLGGPAAPHFTPDQLLFHDGYAIGGPGMRRIVTLATGAISRDSISANELRMEAASAPPQSPSPTPSLDASAAHAKQAQDAQTEEPSAPVELRSDFNETAFWYPHLLTNADGSVTFEFKVPDSVTSWNVWVHAITQDFKSGSIHREARSVKELMVRPYIPRFLREGDEAEIRVVVNNASERELKGALDFDIIDTATEQSILSSFGLAQADATGRAFTALPGEGTNLSFRIKTPSRVGQIAFKATARSGNFSDGELRPIPILPGRMHLMQSRFITMKDPEKRVIRFEDLARGGDPTLINEQLVVTLDAQLFYSVLSAVPYLVNYPYECTEQTLNRFLSTGILTSLYRQYPAIDRMAKQFSSRETRFERWDAPDPNRKMALEETPWLQAAQGGKNESSELINVLDSRIAQAQRESSLSKLRQSQTSLGGFPWFPGGPPSPYMTVYLLHGFSKALEFGVDVPRDMVQRAWDYTHRHYLDEIVREMMARDAGWEMVTFINYVLSNFPDASWYQNSFTPAERKAMLDFSFKHWKDHSPYLKGYLALTLKRMDRPKDAILVWESVMDSAKTAEDQGTFWAPEDRGWLWYNDRIETHAFAIRTEMELMPDDPKLDGLVLWLFLNKKLNHWKSTRATSEAVYSLAHYLKKTGQLGIREEAAVTVGGSRTEFVFEPDQYTGRKNQVVIPGEKIDPQRSSSITIEKQGKGQMFASATWHFSTERLPQEESGDFLRLSRSYFKRVNNGREYTLQPIREGALLAPGDEVEVHLSISSRHPMEYVHLRDPRAAGFEPASNLSRHKWEFGLFWYEEIRDSGTNFFFERLPQGEYTLKYRIRASTAGEFKVAPASVQPMYAPEFGAYSAGAVLKIQ